MRRFVVVFVAVVALATACSFKPFDFNGDNKADFIWRDVETGVWYEGSSPGAAVRYAGASSDLAVPADYDGDGKYDIAVVKANGDWAKADGSVIKAAFPKPDGGPYAGTSTPVVPVPGDYDGDKKAEPAWFTTHDGVWHFADGSTRSISGGPSVPTGCCLLNLDGDVPVPEDYDGDKKTDLALWDPLSGDWTIEHSSDGTLERIHVIDRMSSTSPLQLPMPGDYDGTGRAQPAIVDKNGWHIAGHAEAIPHMAADWEYLAPADYDGDGKVDISEVGADGRWRTQGQPFDTVLPSNGLPKGMPAATPMWFVISIARLTLLGRNLVGCERGTLTYCAGYDAADASNLLWIDRTTGAWNLSTTGPPGSPFEAVRYQGSPTDTPVPADYDGDGRTEIAVVKSNGDWVRGDGTTIASFAKPTGGDETPSGVAPIAPVPADYDGDGKAEPAWYRTVDGTWFVRGRNPEVFGNGPTTRAGVPPGAVDADLPVPADYDGDHKADLARFNPRTGTWTIRSSANGSVRTTVVTPPAGPAPSPQTWNWFQYPVPADYDGVGHAQPALFDNAGWHIEGHAQVDPFGAGTITFDSSGGIGAVPAIADYNSDGHADPAYVDQRGEWFVKGRNQITTMATLGTALNGNWPNLRSTPVLFSQAQFANTERLFVLAKCLNDPTICA